MCGIALVAGGSPNQVIWRMMLEALRPRGEVEEVRVGASLLAGVHRLKIVDAQRSVQPWMSADGRWLLCAHQNTDNIVPFRLDPATGQTRGQVSVGQANRFATPAIYGNLVLVPTLTGVVFVRTS